MFVYFVKLKYLENLQKAMPVMQGGMSSYLSDNHDNLTSQSITSSFGLRSNIRLIFG